METEEINIAEILKDAPKGTKLYSPIIGDCELNEVANGVIWVSIDENDISFNHCGLYGRYDLSEGAECILFPSKDNRDWSTFKAPWKHKHFEPYQKVLVCAGSTKIYKNCWYADIYSHFEESANTHKTISGRVVLDKNILPYEGNESLLGKEVEE